MQLKRNRHHLVVLALFAASLLAATLSAQTNGQTNGATNAISVSEHPGVSASPDADESKQTDVIRLATKAQILAASLSEVVGTAVSPLLGIGVIGTVGYFRAPSSQRATLPWYNRPRFWVPVLAILLLVLLKDSVGGALPFLKKPLDAVELLENKASALVASPIVVQQFVDTIMRLTNDGAALAGLWGRLFPVAYAADGGLGAAAGGVLAIVTQATAAVAALTIFFVVFALAHVVNVLVLLSPFGPLDLLLKAARVAVIGLIASSAALNPVLGLIICAVVIGLSMWMFGWSFRFTTFGSVMAWELLIGSGSRQDSTPGTGYLAFTAAGLAVVPLRTLGWLRRTPHGGLELLYRPFLVLPQRRVTVATHVADLAIGRGTLSPCLVVTTGDNGYRSLLRFSPRFRGGERALAHELAIERVRDVSIGRGLRAALGWLRGDGSEITEPVASSTRGLG